MCFFSLIAMSFGIGYADEFHYNNLLIGDRASGMGGAYTAISDDASGLYYNPAGIVYSSGRNLSASVNAYYNLTKTYNNAIGSSDWVRTSSSLLPNYFGIVQPLGKYKFGFSYAVSDSAQEDQDQTFSNPPGMTVGGLPVTQYVINFNNQNATYNVGPSLAAEVTSKLAVGATLYFYQKNNQFILNEIKTTAVNTQYFQNNAYYTREENGIRPMLGVMWSPIDKLSLGVAVSQVYLLSSKTYGQQNLVTSGTATLSQFHVTDKRKYPLQVRAGAAYFATKNWLLSADASYYSKVENPTFGESNVSVTNIALGTEYYLSNAWAFRGGLFTNMANTPAVTTDPNTSPEEHVNIFGGSASISTFTRNTSVTLGASMSSGKGQAHITGGTGIQDLQTQGWTVSLSSTYSY